MSNYYAVRLRSYAAAHFEWSVVNTITWHFAEAKLQSSQRILRTGVFRRVTIDEEPRLSGETDVHLVVTVEESPATTIGAGGGLQAGRQIVILDTG